MIFYHETLLFHDKMYFCLVKTIGQCIAEQRLCKRWTQEKLASEIGMHQSILSDIENDKRSPKWDTVCQIANRMDVPLISLLPVNATNDNVNNDEHFEEEKKLWESLLKTKDELLAEKDYIIQLYKTGDLS